MTGLRNYGDEALNPVPTLLDPTIDADEITFIQSGTGAVAHSVQDELRDSVSVFQFMTDAEKADVQARTLLIDVTTSTDKAVTYAKANKKRLRWPAGSYLRTLSLDGTFANDASANFMMYGDGKGVTFIEGLLTELYPIVDYTGNTRGELRDMTVRSTGTTSKATCAFLSAKPTAGGSLGNTVTVENCALQVPTSGNANAIIGAVFYNTDLSKCINTECYGPAGATFGFTKSAGVSSKFAGSSATTDSTNYFIDKSVFTGDSGVPLEFTGGAAITIPSAYCALVGGGTGGSIFRVNSSSGSSGNAIFAGHLRTENQSSATGVPAVYFKAKCTLADIHGELETDSTGVMFKSDAIQLTNFNAHVAAAGTGDLFALGGGIARARIIATTGTNLVGTVADVTSTNTHDVEIRGGITEASIIAALGATIGLKMVQGAAVYESINKSLFAPGSTSQLFRPLGNFSQAGIGMTAYTGGSGEQLVYSYTIKGAALDGTSISPPIAAILELFGSTPAGSGVNGRLRVNLIQGAGNIDILDTGANIPAAASNIRLTTKLLGVGTTNSRCHCEFQMTPNATLGTPSVFSKYTNIQGTIQLNADFTFNLYVTNTGNSPYSFDNQNGHLI